MASEFISITNCQLVPCQKDECAGDGNGSNLADWESENGGGSSETDSITSRRRDDKRSRKGMNKNRM